MRKLFTIGLVLSLMGFADDNGLSISNNDDHGVEAHLNIRDLPDHKIEMSLILHNQDNRVLKVPTRRPGGSDQMILRVIKGDCLTLSNVWGATRALKGNRAIEVKVPPDEIGEVALNPGQYARVEPIIVDLKWIKSNGIRKIVYSYESNLLGDSANDLWSGSAEVELDLTEMLERRLPE